MEKVTFDNTTNKQFKLPFSNYFDKMGNNPTWKIKLLLLIILSYFATIIQNNITNQNEWFKYKGIDSNQLQLNSDSNVWIQGINGIFISLFQVFIVFLIFLLVSKIMKSSVKSKSLFSASITYVLITMVFIMIINLIQLLFGLNYPMFQLDSLVIFQKGNLYLSAFSLRNLLSALLSFMVYYHTSKMTKKSSVIWALVALISLTIIGLLGAWFAEISISFMS